MAKIGQASRSKSADSEDSFWEKFTLALVDGNADNWFADFSPESLSELFPNQTAEGDLNHLLSHVVKRDLSIVPSFEVDFSEFSNPVDVESTNLGRAIISFLNKRGVAMNYKTSWQVTHEAVADLDVRVRLEGQWGTAAGTPFLQSFEVRTDEKGREVGFWFVDLMASPVPLENFNHFELIDEDGSASSYAIPDDVLTEGGWTIGQISTKAHLPLLVKQLAYMSETPFPSTQLMQMSRDVAFTDVPSGARPKPFFAILKNEAVHSYSKSLSMDVGDGQNLYEGSLYPEVVVFGWHFDSEIIDHLETALPVVVDGCTYAMSTVEDGFENYRDLNYAAPWDDVVASPVARLASYETRGSRFGVPQWIPITHLGEISYRTKVMYAEAIRTRSLGKKDQAPIKLNSVVSDGAGPYLVHAINTLCYSHLLPSLIQDPEGLGEVEFLLGQAISMQMHEQSTNALGNLGIAYYLVGDYASAENALKSALDRDDAFSEAEASYFLALVLERQGRTAEANEYHSRSKVAGGIEPPSWLDSSSHQSSNKLGLGKAETTGLGLKPSFCPECGSKFQSLDAKFCTDCGQRRT